MKNINLYDFLKRVPGDVIITLFSHLGVIEKTNKELLHHPSALKRYNTCSFFPNDSSDGKKLSLNIIVEFIKEED